MKKIVLLFASLNLLGSAANADVFRLILGTRSYKSTYGGSDLISASMESLEICEANGKDMMRKYQLGTETDVIPYIGYECIKTSSSNSPNYWLIIAGRKWSTSLLSIPMNSLTQCNTGGEKIMRNNLIHGRVFSHFSYSCLSNQ